MVVYGINVLKETKKEDIKRVYTSREEAIKYCEENNIIYQQVTNDYLHKITKGNHQGVVIEIKDYNYYNLKDVEGEFVVMLDHLEDPHNFGAIIRTCAAAGVTSIIIPKDRSVRITDTVVKTSAGTINRVKIIMVRNLVDSIKKLQKQGYFVYGADASGDNYQQIDFSGKKVLVIGNEGKGISPLVKKNCDFLISIPLENNVESLNASVAAGILIYAGYQNDRKRLWINLLSPRK